MPHISGRPEIQAGYFHEAGDASKTGTALRASYRPSISDRITNRFAQMNKPALAGFVNGLRSLRLNQAKSAAGRQVQSARARFEAIDKEEGSSSEALKSAARELYNLEHQERRLADKLDIGAAAQEGNMGAKTRAANADLRNDLKEKGYEAMENLGAVEHEKIDSNYLVSSQDGHRIKVNSERPPLMARMIADSVSQGYDRGSSGAGRTMLSTMQHALVGVYSAEQSIKGMAAKQLAKSSFLDQGARARMDVRAARTKQKISQLQAAFDGNVVLEDTFRGVVGQQQKAADALTTRADSPYEERVVPGGVKPPQTRFWERKVDAYYKTPAAGEGGDAGDGANAAPRRAGAIARFAVGVANLRAKGMQRHHAWRAKANSASARDSSTEGSKARFDQRADFHDAAAARWEHTATVRSSALQGKLIDTLKAEPTRELLDRAAPRIEDL